MRYARKRAKELAETDHFAHPADSPFGENLAWSSKKSSSCQELMSMWYNEIKLYNYRSPSFNSEIGHFTQLVWKDSTRVGCARGFSKRGKGVYLVCNYDPPGNVIGEFHSQVPPQKSGYSLDKSPKKKPAPTSVQKQKQKKQQKKHTQNAKLQQLQSSTSTHSLPTSTHSSLMSSSTMASAFSSSSSSSSLG